MRISDYVLRSVNMNPDRVAVRDGKASYTYREAQDFIDRVAGALKVHAPPGSHVAIYSPNDGRISLLHLAISRADMAWISLHPGAAHAANAAILEQFGCAVMFYHPAFAAGAEIVRERLPSVRLVAMDAVPGGDPTLADWIGTATAAVDYLPERADGVALLQPTGGTTGRPKGVIHTHRSLEACILAFIHEDDTLAGAEMLVVAPLTHAAGLRALACLAAGGTLTVLPGFDVEAVLDAIARHRITSVFLPPTALYALMDHPRTAGADLRSLRNVTVGAAPMAPDRFYRAIQLFGPILYEGYGQTEALAPIVHKRPSDYLRPDGSLDDLVVRSIGRPVFNVHLEILDEEGRVLGPGAIGELAIRSSAVMAGYFGDAAATAAASRFGWHHTDDVGFKDERGFVTLLDRKKDMIISGGINIYPAQVEAAINGHPSVRDSIVVGVPDEKWGEAVKAVVECRPGMNVEAEELLELCRTQLGRVYVPKSIEFWETLPRSAVGKLLRRTVREKFWAGVDRRI